MSTVAIFLVVISVLALFSVVKSCVEWAVSFGSSLAGRLEFLRVIVRPTRVERIARSLASAAIRDGVARWQPPPESGGEQEAIEIWYSRVAQKFVVMTRRRSSFVQEYALEREVMLRLDHVRSAIDQGAGSDPLQPTGGVGPGIEALPRWFGRARQGRQDQLARGQLEE